MFPLKILFGKMQCIWIDMFSLWGKSGVWWGIHYFLISALKHRLWLPVRTDTSLRRFERVPTINGLTRNKKKIKQNHLKIFIIFKLKIQCILNRRVFVVNITFFLCPQLNQIHDIHNRADDLFVQLFTHTRTRARTPPPPTHTHTHLIFSRIHHMWKIRPNFSHLYSPKISHVKYPTEYIKREEFDIIRHTCEQLDLVTVMTYSTEFITCEKSDRFSHLHPPIMPRVIYSTDYIKRE